MKHNRWIELLTILCILIFFGIAGNFDYEEEVKNNSPYEYLLSEGDQQTWKKQYL